MQADVDGRRSSGHVRLAEQARVYVPRERGMESVPAFAFALEAIRDRVVESFAGPKSHEPQEGRRLFPSNNQRLLKSLSINFRPGIPILVAVACNTPSGLPIEIKSSFAGGDDEGALWCGRSRRSCGCDPADAGSEVRGGVANAAALLDELARRGALEVEVGREFGSTEASNARRQ